MTKKLAWKVVDKVEDSGRGYDRIFSGEQMTATVENGFASVGDEVALKGGRLYKAPKYQSPPKLSTPLAPTPGGYFDARGTFTQFTFRGVVPNLSIRLGTTALKIYAIH
jgi:hypothetical protein